MGGWGGPIRTGGGSDGRAANLPVYGGSQVILRRPQFSADDSMTVPPPANLNTPRA